MELVKIQADAEIIEAIQKGSGLDQAVRNIYRNYFESLGWLVKNNNGSQQDAEDIFQEVVISFIEIVQKDKFRGDSTIKTFLYSMVKHSWLNELKRRGRSDARELKYEKARPQEEMDVSQQMIEKESRKQVMEIVEKLGETCKKILVMFYYENRPMKEILASLNYENEQVVRNKKYKCLKQLEQMITKDPSLTQTLKNLLNG